MVQFDGRSLAPAPDGTAVPRVGRLHPALGRYAPRIDVFHELDSMSRQRIWDGINARNVHGERMTLGVVELDPGAVAPEHSHPHEQFGVVLAGSVLFRIGDETKDLGPGSVYVIPANAPHTAEAGPDGTVLIDVFSPVREEWQAAPAADPAEPRWPS